MSGKPEQIHCPILQRTVEIKPRSQSELKDLLGYLKGAKHTREYLSPTGCVTQGRLDLCKQSLGPGGADLILNGLASQPDSNAFIGALLLGTNGLGNSGAKSLRSFLASNSNLHTLYLGCNGITEVGLEDILSGIRLKKEVRSLWLKRNPIGDRGAKLLADYLQKESLSTLDLVNTGITTIGLKLIVSALILNPTAVTWLYIGCNDLGIADVTLIEELISKSSLQGLFLDCNHFGDEGVSRIIQSLRNSQTIRALSIASSGVTEKLHESLTTLEQSRLTHFMCGQAKSAPKLGYLPNQLRWGAEQLAPLVPQLDAIDLRGNDIPTSSLELLIKSAESSTTPAFLQLSKNHLTRLQRKRLEVICASRPPVPQNVNPDSTHIVSTGRLQS